MTTEVTPADAQSALIASKCGQPCDADHILRTERLATDWLAMLYNLSLPPIELPRTNPTGVSEHPSVPSTVFTREIVDVIHRLDANLFDEFGYQHRWDVPFELD